VPNPHTSVFFLHIPIKKSEALSVRGGVEDLCTPCLMSRQLRLEFIQLDYILSYMELCRIISRKLRKVWVSRPKLTSIWRVGSGRPRPIIPQGLGQSTQTHLHMEGWVKTTKAHHSTRFGSVDPNPPPYCGCSLW
jgi:hypothetical protein